MSDDMKVIKCGIYSRAATKCGTASIRANMVPAYYLSFGPTNSVCTYGCMFCITCMYYIYNATCDTVSMITVSVRPQTRISIWLPWVTRHMLL